MEVGTCHGHSLLSLLVDGGNGVHAQESKPWFPVTVLVEAARATTATCHGLGGFSHRNLFLTVLRLEVQDEGVSRAGFFGGPSWLAGGHLPDLPHCLLCAPAPPGTLCVLICSAYEVTIRLGWSPPSQ